MHIIRAYVEEELVNPPRYIPYHEMTRSRHHKIYILPRDDQKQTPQDYSKN